MSSLPHAGGHHRGRTAAGPRPSPASPAAPDPAATTIPLSFSFHASNLPNRRAVFPLPPLDEPSYLPTKSRRLQQRRKRKLFVVRAVNAAIRALNVLAAGGPSSRPAKPPSVVPAVTATQRSLIEGIYQSTLQLCRAGAYPASDSGGLPEFIKWDPYHKAPSDYRRLRADRMSLPNEGAGSVCLLDNLPPHLRERYSDPAQVLREDIPWDEIRRLRYHVGVEPGEYLPIVLRLKGAQMCKFLEAEQCLVVNGIFGVAKDEDVDRVVVDGRPCSLAFKDPEKVELPNPALLARVVVPAGRSLYVGKKDLDNYFHRLATPDYWLPFMCIPPVWSDEVGLSGPRRRVFPALCTLAMGFSHASLLAHAVHEHVLDPVPFFGREHRITSEGSTALILRDDAVSHLIYIDDLMGLSLSRELMDDFHSIADQRYMESRLPPKKKKDVRPPREGVPPPVTGLGMGLYASGITRPGADFFRDLLKATIGMLKCGYSTGEGLRQLLGSWVWGLLVRRCAFSVLAESFRYVHETGFRVGRIWAVVRAELSILVGIAPLLFADLTRPVADVVVASDASSWGAGVVYCRPSRAERSALLSAQELQGWYTTLEEGRVAPSRSRPLPASLLALCRRDNWKVAICSKWKRKRHINIGEISAHTMGLEWAVRARRFHNTLLPFLLDSSVCLGALVKGRSSSRQLLFYCRKSCALQLAANITPIFVFVPSEFQPADAASRGASRR